MYLWNYRRQKVRCTISEVAFMRGVTVPSSGHVVNDRQSGITVIVIKLKYPAHYSASLWLFKEETTSICNGKEGRNKYVSA